MLMNVGNALKVTCVGFAGGVLLRVVQMLFFFDTETGFYTDNGIMAGICLIFVIAASVLACVMCFRSRRYFGPYVPRKNIGTGIMAVASGLILIGAAVVEYLDFQMKSSMGTADYNTTESQVIHIAFFLASFLFGLVQIFVSFGFFQGRNMLQKVPLLYLVAVFWGICYLILVYVFYAKSALFTENFFAVLSGASTLLSLFYLCKLFSGVDEESAAKRLFVCAVCAVVLTITYSLSNVALLLLGKSYSGEIPAAVQLGNLGVAFFILMFLVTFRKYSLRRTPKATHGKENEGGQERPAGGRRFQKP